MSLPDVDWLVRPVAPPADSAVSAVLAERYGVAGVLRELGSQQDRNYQVGEFVFKVVNPSVSEAELRAHAAAVEQLALKLPDVRLPRCVPGLDGDVVQPFTGTGLSCQLLEFVPGEPVMDSRYLAPAFVSRLGEIAGRITVALAGFDAPEGDHFRPWDLRNSLMVVEALAPRWSDEARAARVLEAAREAYAALDTYAGQLPVQFVHGDVTDNNIVCETGADGRRLPVGVIDFGDLGTGWTVAELAVACTSVLHHHGAGPATTLPAIRAFDTVRPLTGPEIESLWPLVVLRAAVLVVSGQHDVSQDPGNGYASAALDREWTMFERAVSVPAEVMAGQVRDSLGRDLPGSAEAAPRLVHDLLPGFRGGEVEVLDLSVENGELHGGRWQEAEVGVESAAGRRAVRTRHGEFRLTRTEFDRTDAAATCALGVEMSVDSPQTLVAPWPGAVTVHPDGAVSLRGGELTLWVYGVAGAVSAEVRAGAELGVAEGYFGIQLSRLGDVRPPRFAPPELAAGWLAVCPDPTGLLNGASDKASCQETDTALLDRRAAHFAPVQEHYYTDPPRIERGWRHHLIDTQGRAYLDMLNNVTILGHGHPVLSDAVHRQWRLLNTNSRFHYASVVELSERLTALLPDGLDTVFLVNSGSEAVDLALRLAWAATGRQDTVAVEEAYHGWTYASDAVSTSVADNPNALESRPSWVHTVAAPNSYRGVHRGAEAHRYAPEAALRIAEVRPGAFICEPFYGNAGGIPLPDGYLREVYAATRAVGGLCVADEVQVGYGRLGTHFWGFEQQGVVPDIVTVAKAMGNGHPLGAVITRREIADAYRGQGYFFSSAGGSPVSSVVGLTVLDVLRDERLQDNALEIGTHLKRGLEQLAVKHPLIGAVHGSGLYLGVEFVRDRETLEPATEETAAICERLLELGVVVQPTSDRQCVLKIKPPLCLTRRSADLFVAALDDALTHGW